MRHNLTKQSPFTKLRKSKRALAIPTTFLILFFSMILMISVTYAIAIERINTQTSTLKIETAKQDMTSFDQAILAAASQPGSCRTITISDSGGKTSIQPLNNSLSIFAYDGNSISQSVFDQTIGEVFYILPSIDSLDANIYIKGDMRTIVNQSGAIITQLYTRNGATGPEIALSYRPTVSFATNGLQDNKTVNTMRIYIINLNSSDTISIYGEIPLKVSYESTQVTTFTYNVSNETTTLSFTANLNDVQSSVLVPIVSTDNGAMINLEVVVCNLKIERCLM